MSKVLAAIAAHAQRKPQATALSDGRTTLGYAALRDQVQALAADLKRTGAHTVAVLADNGLAWALIDLATLAAGLRAVPLPPFFSPAQLAHAIRSGAVDLLIADARLPLAAFGIRDTFALEHLPAGCGLVAARLPASDAARAAIHTGTQKITYTSGTTGEPKGVCLALDAMEQVAASLAEASGARLGDTHLSALPLSTLLENIGGLYAPLLVGACAQLRPLAEVGLEGATRIDGAKLLAALRDTRAGSAILVPQMLRALVDEMDATRERLPALRFLAVGGAPTAPGLLHRAQRLGLPVYEGYGLSECASVVALNREGAQRIGAVGRPLPHLRLSFGTDGEVRVHGPHFLGYVGAPRLPADAALETGDLGHLDADGYLVLTGRKKNLFVTAFGRNVAPEWVERELCEEPVIAQAAVFGEARPFNAAVIVGRGATEQIDAALARVNARLPDYARIARWIAADAPFATDNQQLTANGRLRRERIAAVYGARLDTLYPAKPQEVCIP